MSGINPSPISSGASNESPPPSRRRHRYRFVRSHRLLGYDRSEERCLPRDRWFADLRREVRSTYLQLARALCRSQSNLAQLSDRVSCGKDFGWMRLERGRRRGFSGASANVCESGLGAECQRVDLIRAGESVGLLQYLFGRFVLIKPGKAFAEK